MNRPGNADAFSQLFSIGNGVVAFVGLLTSTWGNVIITKHELDGLTLYARYAHVDSYVVSRGQSLVRGQLIGFVGNANNQLSYHLHFDISPTAILESIPGHWPGENLLSLRQNYIEPRAAILISQSGFTNKLMTVQSAANFRAGPSTAYFIYDVLQAGVQVISLGIVDNYHLVNINGEYGFIHDSLFQEPVPIGNALLGIHTSADPGDISESEFQLFQTAKADCIKVLSAHSSSSIARLANESGNAPIIIRAFLDWGNRNITPQQFFDWTFPDVQRSVNAIGGGREIWIELGNEPNIPSEGLGYSWNNGTEFGNWLLQVLNLYKNALQGVLFLYPGLSPGFTSYRAFLADSMASALVCDGVALHSYWSSDYSMNQALIDTVDYYAQMFGNKPLWVSEASHNRCGITASQKGLQYITFWNELKKRPSVKGATYFVASASNSVFSWNGGSCETWLDTDIAAVVGSR